MTESAQPAEIHNASPGSAGPVFFILDYANVVRHISPAAGRLLGLPLSACRGRPFLDIVHADDRERASQAAAGLVDAAGGFGRLRLRLVRPDGSCRDVELEMFKLAGIAGFDGAFLIERDKASPQREAAPASMMDEVDGVLSAIIAPFIYHTNEKFNDCIGFTLKTIGQFAGVDRFSIFQQKADKQPFVKTYEWCDDGIEGRMGKASLDMDGFPRLMETMTNLDTLSVESISDIRGEYPQFSVWLESEGIRSILLAPMVFNERLFGIIAYESVTRPRGWSPKDRLTIKTVGNVIASGIKRKENEDELVRSQTMFMLMFEFAPDAYYMNDADGVFVDGNYAAEVLTGFPRDDIVGRSMLECGLLDESQLARAAEALAVNLEGRPWGPGEFTLNRKDGSRVEVEIKTMPMELEGKTVILGLARDISGRKRTERMLSESEGRYRQLFENSPSAIVAIGLDGKVMECNEAFASLVGIPRGSLVGNQFWDLGILRDDNLSELKNRFMERLGGGPASRTTEIQIKQNGGAPRWIEARVGRLMENGEVRGIQAIITDITERKSKSC